MGLHSGAFLVREQVVCGYFCAVFGSFWSVLERFGPFRSFRLVLVRLGPIWPDWDVFARLDWGLAPFGQILSVLVLFGPF